jgi:hypothetical protein
MIPASIAIASKHPITLKSFFLFMSFLLANDFLRYFLSRASQFSATFILESRFSVFSRVVVAQRG